METRLHFDNGNMTVENVQDVSDILENNKRLRSIAQKSDWGRHVASIPNVIMTRWLNEAFAEGNTTIKLFGPEMDALVDKKLKDPEWSYLRTDSKHVQSWIGYSGK